MSTSTKSETFDKFLKVATLEAPSHIDPLEAWRTVQGGRESLLAEALDAIRDLNDLIFDAVATEHGLNERLWEEDQNKVAAASERAESMCVTLKTDGVHFYVEFAGNVIFTSEEDDRDFLDRDDNVRMSVEDHLRAKIREFGEQAQVLTAIKDVLE